MSRFLALSLVAVVLGLVPLALAMLGFAAWALAGCVEPPFAQAATGLCGVAETLKGLIFWAVWPLPLAVLGAVAVVIWSFSLMRWR